AVDGDGVLRRNVLGVRRHTPRRRQTGHVVGLLDRHRHAVQWSPDLPPGQRAIGGAGARPRAVEIAHDDGIEGAVVLFDPRQVQVEQLETADLLLSDVGGELLGGAEGDVEHGRPPGRWSSLRSAIEVYCVSYAPKGTSVSESIRPHPVLEAWYPVQAERASFVDELFDGAARHYNHI